MKTYFYSYCIYRDGVKSAFGSAFIVNASDYGGAYESAVTKIENENNEAGNIIHFMAFNRVG